jgi:hypothetical protein
MPVTDPLTLDSRRWTDWLPRSLWISLAAVGLAVFTLVLVWMFRTPGREFDQQLWRDYADLNQTGRYPRLEMADRFLAMGGLGGQSRAEIVDMLGEPPDTKYFRDWDLVYWLGPERGFMSIDSEWLVFRLDTRGRVVDYRVVRD